MLEAASRLGETLRAPDKAAKPVPDSSWPVAFKDNYQRVAELTKGIHDAAANVGSLCLIIFKAWAAQAFGELNKTSPRSKQTVSAVTGPVPELDQLQNMALALQGKLANLAAMAVDALIGEMDIPGGQVE